MLNRLSNIRPDLRLTSAIIQLLTEQAKERKWRQSTLLRHLCCAQGALACLGLYRAGATTLPVKNCAAWRAALRAAGISAREELPSQAQIVTYEQLAAAVEAEPDMTVKTTLILAWMCCVRVGCTLQLTRSDVEILPGKTALLVRFRHGKTVRFSGVYNIFTGPLPQKWLEIVKNWQAGQEDINLQGSGATGLSVLAALRRIDPALSQRSIRRGALQALAEAEVPETTIIKFSGHASLAMLRRYLQWGACTRATETEMQNAARSHAPELHEEMYHLMEGHIETLIETP